MIQPDDERLPQTQPKPRELNWATGVFEILALSSFAISQPIFDLLKRNPEFLVARRSEPLDIVLLIVGLSIIPAGVLLLSEGLALLLGRRVQQALHAIWLGCLSGLILMPGLRSWPRMPGYGLLMAALLLGLAASLLYLRLRTRRFSLVFLFPALIIFPLLFLFHPSIHKLTLSRKGPGIASVPSIGNPAPIVMVVFDEFPLTSLLNEKLEINTLLYPHFSELAKTAVWYRNATAVSEGTLSAVPSILDGRYPDPDLQLLPNAEDHPRSLFTLLGRSYRYHVLENDTRMCPDSLCIDNAAKVSLVRQFRGITSDLSVLYFHRILPADLARKLPDISLSWRDFVPQAEGKQPRASKMALYEDNTDFNNRQEVFNKFIDSIAVTAKPTLYYLHSLLPHAPWEYLSSGKRYTRDMNVRGLRGVNGQGADPNFWSGDPWLVVQSYQRHLLQVQLVDNLLGHLTDHMKAIGLYDRALLIVIGDHGCSFRPQDSRRRLTRSNWIDIMAVPLFIKSPSQKEGRIVDENMEGIDLLPTVAEILEADMPWNVDGRSIAALVANPKPQKVFVNEEGERFTFKPSMQALADAVKQKIDLFGAGDQENQLFKIGSYGRLVGQRVADLEVTSGVPDQVTLDDSTYFNSVDSRSSFLPAYISGQILPSQRSPSSPLQLAVAVNGAIQAVTTSYEQDKERRFSALAPESAVREGANDVRVFAISDLNGKLKLAELTKTDLTREYSWGTRIAFGKKGNSISYQAEGWSRPDDGFTWIDGRRGTLVLPVPRAGGSIQLQAGVMAYVVPDRIERQLIRVSVNRQPAGEWEITNRDLQDRVLLIPEALLAGSEMMVITFEIPGAVSPAGLGMGPDIRELGLGVAWLELSRAK